MSNLYIEIGKVNYLQPVVYFRVVINYFAYRINSFYYEISYEITGCGFSSKHENPRRNINRGIFLDLIVHTYNV
jgi:hypothetical protein